MPGRPRLHFYDNNDIVSDWLKGGRVWEQVWEKGVGAGCGSVLCVGAGSAGCMWERADDTSLTRGPLPLLTCAPSTC